GAQTNRCALDGRCERRRHPERVPVDGGADHPAVAVHPELAAVRDDAQRLIADAGRAVDADRQLGDVVQPYDRVLQVGVAIEIGAREYAGVAGREIFLDARGCRFPEARPPGVEMDEAIRLVQAGPAQLQWAELEPQTPQVEALRLQIRGQPFGVQRRL